MGELQKILMKDPEGWGYRPGLQVKLNKKNDFYDSFKYINKRIAKSASQYKPKSGLKLSPEFLSVINRLINIHYN